MNQLKARSTALPPLPFGERLATLSADSKSYGDHVAAATPSLQACEPLDDKGEFRTKSFAMEINGLKLAAGANTPVRLEFGAAGRTHILVPFFGTSLTTTEEYSFNWNAGQHAVYLPPVERAVTSSTRSYLHIGVDPDRLQQSARAMLGLGQDEVVDLNLTHTRLLALRSPGQSTDTSWHQIFSMIDSMCETPKVLAQLGLDEVVYRNAVLMLRPDLFDRNPIRGEQKKVRVASQRILDPVCTYIQSRLEERITLSDMERVSGLSSRGLQYAFLQRYQCSPMQWVRDARLDRARDMLRKNEPGLTISAIAEQLGFAKHSAFSAQFLARFGATPSSFLNQQHRS